MGDRIPGVSKRRNGNMGKRELLTKKECATPRGNIIRGTERVTPKSKGVLKQRARFREDFASDGRLKRTQGVTAAREGLANPLSQRLLPALFTGKINGAARGVRASVLHRDTLKEELIDQFKQ